jgi:methyl-accepting chemotaxis protein
VKRQINRALSQIDQATQQNAGATNGVSVTAGNVSRESSQLKNVVAVLFATVHGQEKEVSRKFKHV